MISDLSLFIPSDVLNALEQGAPEDTVIALINNRLPEERSESAQTLYTFYKDMLAQEKNHD